MTLNNLMSSRNDFFAITAFVVEVLVLTAVYLSIWMLRLLNYNHQLRWPNSTVHVNTAITWQQLAVWLGMQASSRQPAEVETEQQNEEKKVIYVTLNMVYLLVPDMLFWLFHKLMIFNFHAQPFVFRMIWKWEKESSDHHFSG